MTAGAVTLMRLLLLILALPLAGCTTLVVRKTAPDGTVTQVEYYSWGRDKAAEELSVPTSNGTATLRGGSSTVNPAINDVAATLRNISERAVVP